MSTTGGARPGGVRPLVVVEGGPPTLAAILATLGQQGWPVRHRWEAARPGVVVTGAVVSLDDAAQAVLAVVRGAGVVVDGRGERPVLDRLVDDLRRLGSVAHHVTPAPAAAADMAALDRDAAALLDLLAQGLSLGQAAARLHVSRRTADRKLAAARRALGVTSTAAAVAARRRSD